MQYGRGGGGVKGKGNNAYGAGPPYSRGGGKGGKRSNPTRLHAQAALARMDWQLGEDGVAYCGGHSWDGWMTYLTCTSYQNNQNLVEQSVSSPPDEPLAELDQAVAGMSVQGESHSNAWADITRQKR